MTATETVVDTYTWRAKGFTEDVNQCEHCGKADLKGTVRMVTVDADGGEADDTFMGVVCAARMTGRKAQEIRTEAARADRARDAAIRAAYTAWSDASSSAFIARRDAALGPRARFAEISAFMDSPEEKAAAAAWLAANPKPVDPWEARKSLLQR